MENSSQLSSKQMKKIIEETIKATTQAVIHELKKANLMKSGSATSFQKTEQLLYNYENFKKTIADKHEQIKIIRMVGLPQRSKSITSWTGNHSMNTLSDNEKADAKIEQIESSIYKTSEYIEIIETALSKISNDPYFEIIKLKYFEGKTRESIAEELEVDVSTITRNKNRLINVLKIYMFSNDAMKEIFGVA